MLKRFCGNCKKEFFVKPSRIKYGEGKYCSISCQYEGARKGKTIPCFLCGKKKYRSLHQISRSKSKKFFCSKSCQTKWRNSIYKGKNHANWKGGLSTYKSILKKSNTPMVCVLCKTKDERVLAVHHIDKNRANNKIENLAYLCHNCHHLVHYDTKEYKKFMVLVV